MGKHRKKRPKAHVPQPPAKQRNSLKKFIEWFGVIGSIVTVLGFILGFMIPKLTVDAAGSIQSSSPMGTLFYLSNDGALPIHDVFVTVGNLQITGQNLQVLGFGEFQNVPKEARADTLSPGHKMTLPYAPAFGFTAISNFSGAQLVITAHYRPDYIPWHRTERFPFRAVRTNAGTWEWLSIPQ